MQFYSSACHRKLFKIHILISTMSRYLGWVRKRGPLMLYHLWKYTFPPGYFINMGFNLQRIIWQQMRNIRGMANLCSDKGKIIMLNWNWNETSQDQIPGLNRMSSKTQQRKHMKKSQTPFFCTIRPWIMF